MTLLHAEFEKREEGTFLEFLSRRERAVIWLAPHPSSHPPSPSTGAIARQVWHIEYYTTTIPHKKEPSVAPKAPKKPGPMVYGRCPASDPVKMHDFGSEAEFLHLLFLRPKQRHLCGLAPKQTRVPLPLPLHRRRDEEEEIAPTSRDLPHCH